VIHFGLEPVFVKELAVEDFDDVCRQKLKTFS
jgi:hypothetical protein